MTNPSPCPDNVLQMYTRTRAPLPSSAIRTMAAVVTLAVSAPLLATDEPAQSAASSSLVGGAGQAGTPVPAPDRRAGSDSAGIVELQRQVNDLRSDLLDERERRMARQQETNGFVLVVLGLLIGVWGLWAYAKFRAIASEAKIGAAAARALASGQPNLIPQASALLAAPDLPPRPFSRILRPSVEGDAGPSPGDGGANGSPAGLWASNGHRAGHGPVDEPGPRSGSVLRLRSDGGTPDLDREGEDSELKRYEEVVADCTEAIRLSPDDPRLYLERGNALSGLRIYEAALADYDRVVLHDPDNAAAYIGRCQAKSELGLHDEALEDYEHIVRLDPDLAGSPGRE